MLPTSTVVHPVHVLSQHVELGSPSGRASVWYFMSQGVLSFLVCRLTCQFGNLGMGRLFCL